MSRIGKQPILIPQGVEVKIEGDRVITKGPKGGLVQVVNSKIKVEIENGNIIISPHHRTKESDSLWGLTRTLIANDVEGVVSGYEKRLALEGVGYRASLEGEDLVLKVGFSHLVNVKKPEGIEFKVEKNVIIVSGIDKAEVGQMAAKIRKIKPPEPYKGKGIRYEGEQIRRKVGKRAVGSGG